MWRINYGRSGIGWPSEVSQINATEAMAFHKKYYVGANIVVAVVGDVKASEALPMLEKYFSRVPAGPKPEEMTTVEPKQFAEKTVAIREQTQPIYVEGYHRPDYRDPDDAVYDAISDILSNGRVSRLYRSLVRDQQIAAVAAGLQPLSRRQISRPVCVLAVPLPGHTPAEMRDAIHKEIDKLKTADVTDEELPCSRPAPAPTCCAAWPTIRAWPTLWPSTRPATATGASYSCNWTGWTR